MEEMAADIETVVADRAILAETITDARQSKIQGKHVQEAIADLLDNHDALFRVCQYEYQQRRDEDIKPLDAIVEQLAENDHLSVDMCSEFQAFWDDIKWIVPAVSVPVNNLGGLERHWSDVEVTPIPDQPALFEYTLRWGVDERLDANIPGSRILYRCLMELDQVSRYLHYWRANDEISDEFVAYVANEYELDQVTDALSDILNSLEQIEPDPSPIQDPGETTVEVSWNSETGGKNVVGTLHVLPSEHQAPDQDDGDQPPRGFQ